MRIPGAPKHRQGYLQVRPSDIAGRDDLLLVDVRPEAELGGPAGHIHGIRQVPLEAMRPDGLPLVSVDTPVVLVCADGKQSEEAAALLVREHGFTEVYHLVGGMRRWTAEERPVARRPTWQALSR